MPEGKGEGKGKQKRVKRPARIDATGGFAPKTQLQAFVQREGRPVTKGDIVYTATEIGPDQWQATCQLVILGEDPVEGPIAESQKEAEIAVAREVLLLKQEEIEAFNATIDGPPPPKRPRTVAPPKEIGQSVPICGKAKLKAYCAKVLGRSCREEDILYTALDQGEGQIQVIVKVHCIDGQEFAGEVTEDLEAAEQSAAEEAFKVYEVVPPAIVADAAKHKEASEARPKREKKELSESAKEANGSSSYKATNAKTQLMMYLQKALNAQENKRNCVKGDVTYTLLNMDDGSVQAIVKINCFPDIPEITGETATEQKLAEQSAAYEALKVLPQYLQIPEVELAPINISPAKEAATVSKSIAREQFPATYSAPATYSNAKTELAQYCQGVLRRAMTKADITYSIIQDGDQMQALVKMMCFDGQEIAGETLTDRKDAENSAAAEALKFYDPTGAERSAHSNATKSRDASRGKSRKGRKADNASTGGKGKGPRNSPDDQPRALAISAVPEAAYWQPFGGGKAAKGGHEKGVRQTGVGWRPFGGGGSVPPPPPPLSSKGKSRGKAGRR